MSVGNTLNASCASAGALADAYQKVVDAYGLHAIDIDIEAAAYAGPEVQQRTVDALKNAYGYQQLLGYARQPWDCTKVLARYGG